MDDVALVTPSMEHLPSYADALRRGCSPDNMRQAVAREQVSGRAVDGSVSPYEAAADTASRETPAPSSP